MPDDPAPPDADPRRTRQLSPDELAAVTDKRSAQEQQVPSPYRELHLEGYRFERLLGRGGMGVVLLARQQKLDRLVALKMLGDDLDGDQDMAQRLEREAQTLARLDHPNIVACYDVGTHDGYLYVAMQYVPGGRSVDHVARAMKQVPEKLALEVARQAALGLRYAWSRGVIHRDVKPENLLIYEEERHADGEIYRALREQTARVMIADFGLARVNTAHDEDDQRLTMAGHILGSPAYMAPEQALGEELDCRADIYALGVSLYYLLSGSLPYRGSTIVATLQMKLHQPAPKLRELVPEVSADCQRLIERMMAREREDRYPDYDALLTDLEALRQSEEHSLGGSSIALSPSRRRRRRLGWGIGVVVLLVAGIIGGLLYSRGPSPRRYLTTPEDIRHWTDTEQRWAIAPPDDVSRDHALTSPLGDAEIALNSAVPVRHHLQFEARLPGPAALNVALHEAGGDEVLALAMALRDGRWEWSGQVRGEPLEIAPPDRAPAAREWHRVNLRLFPDQILVFLDDELAAQVNCQKPPDGLRLHLRKTGGTVQLRRFEIAPLPESP